MDFTFFESLSTSEAEQYLQSFLREAGKGFQQTAQELRRDRITSDFSINSISQVFGWILKRINTVPMEPDESLPEWIRQSDGLFDFDDASKTLVLRAAFYLGESFNRYSDKLYWGTGDTDSAKQNMPVVKGFKREMELSPLLVTENLFSRISNHGAPSSDIEQAVKSWLSYL